MIYTVTVNPSLDYHVHLAAPIRRGEIARSEEETVVAAGKGVNVSVVLHRLGAPTRALGFLAGESGRMFESLLTDCPHDFTFLHRGMTRINLKLYDGEETAINAAGPAVTDADYLRLCEKLSALCADDTLVLSGNLQKNAPFSYGNLAEIAVKHGAKFVVDTTGRALLDCLALRPYFIKPNLEELGELFGQTVSDAPQALALCKELQKQGARNVLVSMGADGALLLAENGASFHAVCEKQQKVLTTVGAGDSLVAGFLSAQKKPPAEALAAGIAAGSATVYAGRLADKAQIEALLPFVKVTKL